MTFRNLLSLAARFAAHLFYPENCPVCGRIAQVICLDCLAQTIAEAPCPPLCSACGGEFPCAVHGDRYELRSLTWYRGLARDVLLTAKYGGSGRLAQTLGQELAQMCDGLGQGWTIVAVPPHPKLSLTLKGDSHLEWMARGLSKATGYPVKKCLFWAENRKPQKEQPDARSRRELSASAFAVKGKTVPDKIILLDDVSTTGTTLNRASQRLYKAGAARVVAMCWGAAVLNG